MPKNNNQDDRVHLQMLLADFKHFFMHILDHGNLTKDKAIDDLILNVWNKHIANELKSAVDNATKFPLEQLESCGLTEIQLALKINVFRKLRNLYDELIVKIKNFSINKLISDILDIIKSVIGSLGNLIPGGELIIEFIDAAQGALNIDHWESLLAHQPQS